MALTSGEAPLTSESQGKCRLRLVGDGKEMDVPVSDAEQARQWMDQLMEKARCDLWKTKKEPKIEAFFSNFILIFNKLIKHKNTQKSWSSGH